MSNDWVHIGTFQMEVTQQQPGVVFLNDWTFETNREIAFDAIRWTPVSSMGAADAKQLDVPYRSQEGPGAARYGNDCGATVVAMLIDWQLAKKGQPPSTMTVDQYASETTLASNPSGLRTDQLVTLAAKHGLSLKLTNNADLQAIMAEITAGRPT